MRYINLLEIFYPVGSIYFSTINISPSSLIGGTWKPIENAVIRSTTGNIGYIGSDTHTLTINEMPSHTHNQYVTANSGTEPRMDYNSDGAFNKYYQTKTGPTGGGKAHSIVQRSYNLYAWERVS